MRMQEFANTVKQISQAGSPEMLLELKTINLAVASCCAWWEAATDMASLIETEDMPSKPQASAMLALGQFDSIENYCVSLEAASRFKYEEVVTFFRTSVEPLLVRLSAEITHLAKDTLQ